MKSNLDTLPIKTLLKIIETGDSSVLGENHEAEWKELYKAYKELDPSGESSKVFKIVKDIDVLKLRQKMVLLALDGLKFDRSEELINILQELGYKFGDDYFNEIERIEKVVKNIDIKISRLESKLPKKTEKQNSIDEVIMSYNVITGLAYDTNTISVTQFYALQKAVNDKVKSLEKTK